MPSDELPTENCGKEKPPSNRSRPQIDTALKKYKKQIEAAASIRENTVSNFCVQGSNVCELVLFNNIFVQLF